MAIKTGWETTIFIQRRVVEQVSRNTQAVHMSDSSLPERTFLPFDQIILPSVCLLNDILLRQTDAPEVFASGVTNGALPSPPANRGGYPNAVGIFYYHGQLCHPLFISRSFPMAGKYYEEEDGYGETDGGGPGVDNGVADIPMQHQSPIYDLPNPRKTVILVNDIPYSTYRALIYYVSIHGWQAKLLVLIFMQLYTDNVVFAPLAWVSTVGKQN
jgi:hypothetical protein